MDLAYFFFTAFLVTYGLILVVRGYLILGLDRLRGSATGRS